jgi:hypothetical protein
VTRDDALKLASLALDGDESAIETIRRARKPRTTPGKRGRPQHPRREEALALAAKGMAPAEIVSRTGASRRSVDRWMRETGKGPA